MFVTLLLLAYGWMFVTPLLLVYVMDGQREGEEWDRLETKVQNRLLGEITEYLDGDKFKNGSERVSRALNVVPIDTIFNARREEDGGTILHVIVNHLSSFGGQDVDNIHCICGRHTECIYTNTALEVIARRLTPNGRFHELMREPNANGRTPLQHAIDDDVWREFIILFKSYATTEQVNELLLTMTTNDVNEVIDCLDTLGLYFLGKFLNTFEYQPRLHFLKLLSADTINWSRKLSRLWYHRERRDRFWICISNFVKGVIDQRHDFQPEQQLIDEDRASFNSLNKIFGNLNGDVQQCEVVIQHRRARQAVLRRELRERYFETHHAIEQHETAIRECTNEIEEQQQHIKDCHGEKLYVHPELIGLLLKQQYAVEYKQRLTCVLELCEQLQLKQHFREGDEDHNILLWYILQKLIPPEMLGGDGIYIDARLTYRKYTLILERVIALDNIHCFQLLPGSNLEKLFE